MTENPETYLRSAGRRRTEPEAEPEPAKKAPLVTQGARSSPAKPAPPTPDELIRDAARNRATIWRPIG